MWESVWKLGIVTPECWALHSSFSSRPQAHFLPRWPLVRERAEGVVRRAQGSCYSTEPQTNCSLIWQSAILLANFRGFPNLAPFPNLRIPSTLLGMTERISGCAQVHCCQVSGLVGWVMCSLVDCVELISGGMWWLN